jgi:hypothetical protein
MKGSNYPYIALVKQFLVGRKFFACLIGILIISFTLFPVAAQANFVEDGLKSAGAALVSVSVAGVLWLLNWLSVGLLLLAVTVLRTVMAFVLQASYTPLSAGEGRSITIAWGVIRDFSNMLFVLILIAIGVGTMLMNFKLPIPGQQQVGPGLLIKFSIVALLINFTPVITGIIIDVSNIMTKFFFDTAAGGANAFISFNPFLSSAGDWEPTFNLNVAAGLAIQYGTAFLFNLVASLILFMMAFLLAMRVLALWLLVIFSPIAFAASILPQTQKFFNQWWSHFLQWVILPIPVGLFLWVAALMLSTPGSCQISNVGTGGSSGYDIPVNNVLQGRDGGAFCKALMSTMALGTVVAGMFISFSISAKGSGFVVSRAQNIQQGAQKWAGRRTRQTAREVGLRAGARPAAAAGRLAQRVQLDPQLSRRLAGKITGTGAGSKALRGLVRGTLGTAEGMTFGAADKTIGEGIRGAGNAAQGPLSAYRKLAEDAKKKYKGQKWDQYGNNINNPKYEDAAAAIDNALKDDFGDLEKAIASGQLSEARLRTLLQESTKRQDGIFDNFLKRFPQMALMVDPSGGEMNKIIGKFGGKDVGNLSEASLRDGRVVAGLYHADKINKNALEAIGHNTKKMIAFNKGYESYVKDASRSDITPEESALGMNILNRQNEYAEELSRNPWFAAAHQSTRGQTDAEKASAAEDAAREAGSTAGKEEVEKSKES